MDDEDHGHDLVADAVDVAGIVEPRVAAGEDARPLLHVGAIVVARSFHEPDDDQHDPGDGEQPPHSVAIEAGREAHCGDSYHQRLSIAGKIYLTIAVCGRIVEEIEPVRTGTVDSPIVVALDNPQRFEREPRGPRQGHPWRRRAL